MFTIVVISYFVLYHGTATIVKLLFLYHGYYKPAVKYIRMRNLEFYLKLKLKKKIKMNQNDLFKKYHLNIIIINMMCKKGM